MVIFGPKTWVNPFGKNENFFDFLNFLFLQFRKAFLSLYNIIKDIFLALIAQKKNLNKWPFLDQNYGLTPLEKCKFPDFSDFLFLQPRKSFFGSTISEKTFSSPILSKKKKYKNGHLWTKTKGLTPLEKIMSIFRLFELLVFTAYKRRFFVLQYHKRHCPGPYCLKNLEKNGHFLTKTMG